jgi:hypothetical protein
MAAGGLDATLVRVYLPSSSFVWLYDCRHSDIALWQQQSHYFGGRYFATHFDNPPTRLMDRLLQKEKRCLFADAGFFLQEASSDKLLRSWDE